MTSLATLVDRQKVAIGEFSEDVGRALRTRMRAAAHLNDLNEIYRVDIRRTIPAD